MWAQRNVDSASTGCRLGCIAIRVRSTRDALRVGRSASWAWSANRITCSTRCANDVLRLMDQFRREPDDAPAAHVVCRASSARSGWAVASRSTTLRRHLSRSARPRRAERRFMLRSSSICRSKNSKPRLRHDALTCDAAAERVDCVLPDWSDTRADAATDAEASYVNGQASCSDASDPRARRSIGRWRRDSEREHCGSWRLEIRSPADAPNSPDSPDFSMPGCVRAILPDRDVEAVVLDTLVKSACGNGVPRLLRRARAGQSTLGVTG